MCWIGLLTDKYIANRDLKCFKIAKIDLQTNYISSYFQRFDYELGKIYKIPTFNFDYVKEDDIVYQSTGFHSYSLECEIITVCNEVRIYHFNHLIEDYIKYSRNTKLVKLECTIPKGSVYLRNENGELVSDRIIINKQKRLCPTNHPLHGENRSVIGATLNKIEKT